MTPKFKTLATIGICIVVLAATVNYLTTGFGNEENLYPKLEDAGYENLTESFVTNDEVVYRGYPVLVDIEFNPDETNATMHIVFDRIGSNKADTVNISCIYYMDNFENALFPEELSNAPVEMRFDQQKFPWILKSCDFVNERRGTVFNLREWMRDNKDIKRIHTKILARDK